jgi:hypothetical protein
MAKRIDPTQIGAALGRQLLVGLGRIGGRALAASAKSVMRDGRAIAKEAQDRLDRASERIDEMIGGRDE